MAQHSTFDTHLLEKDVYRLSKEELIATLQKHNIPHKSEDIVSDLRPIVAALKGVIKQAQTNTNITDIFTDITTNKLNLTEEDKIKYRELAIIESFITERDNLYDRVPTEEQLINPTTPSVHQEQKDIYEDIDPHTQTYSVTMAENLPLISAGTYAGLPSENPNDFLDKLQIAATSNKWKPDTKLNLFPAHLTGTALAWYKHYKAKHNNVQLQWDKLTTDFIEAFTPWAQVENLQQILEHKIQGHNEPALTYFLDILTLCRRHDPDITDKRIINYIIQGLKPEICERVIAHKNDTLEQLELNLKTAEQIVLTTQANKNKYFRETNQDQHKQSYSQGKTCDLESLRTEVRALTNLVANISVASASNTHARSRSQSPHNSRVHDYKTQHKPHANYDFGKKVHFKDSQDYKTNTTVQGRLKQFCSHCRTNTHNTQECRSSKPKANVHLNHSRDYPRIKNSQFTQILKPPMFCNYCKRTNHNIDTCFRSKFYNGNIPKNA